MWLGRDLSGYERTNLTQVLRGAGGLDHVDRGPPARIAAPFAPFLLRQQEMQAQEGRSVSFHLRTTTAAREMSSLATIAPSGVVVSRRTHRALPEASLTSASFSTSAAVAKASMPAPCPNGTNL